MNRLIVCLACLVVGCTNAEGPPLVIGHVAPADHPARAEAQKQGLELAVKELGSKADAALQNRPVLVRFASASSPEEYESQAVRLTSLGRAFALFGGTSVEEMERLDHVRVPLFSFSSRRSPSLSENAIALSSDPEDQAAAVVTWLKSQGISQATLVKARDGKSEPWATQFSRAWKSLWAEGKNALSIADDQAKLDAETLILGPLPSDSPAWKQIGNGTKRVVLLGAESDAMAAASTLRGTSRQVYWITAFAIDPETKTTGDFAEKYQRAFGKPPASDAVLAYDGLRMLLESLRTTRSAMGDRLTKDLETSTFDGVTGPVRIEKGRMRRPVFVVHAADEGASFDYRWVPEALKTNETKKEVAKK
jgi:hypothetical protein